MDTRTICLLAILGCMATAIVNSLWFGFELRRFAATTTVIESEHQMESFKRVVGNQMYAALFQIVLLSAPLVVFFTGLMLGALHASDILFVVVPSAVIIVIAAIFKTWENRLKTIAVATPELLAERDAVVHTWLRKPWPSW
jgi:hypothetical protein